MTAVNGRRCRACGGRGWKFVLVRRSLIVTSLAERDATRRTRTECLVCAGTGAVPGAEADAA